MRPKTFLQSNFNPALKKSSPVVPSIERTLRYDKNGSEVISFEPIDVQSIVKQNSPAELWNLSRLVSAGVDPSSIKGHSLNGSRIDGYEDIQKVSSSVDDFFDSLESEVKTEE